MTLPPRHVGVFGNAAKPEVRAFLPTLLRAIKAKGRRASVERTLARAVRGTGAGLTLTTLAKQVDVLLVLGGDGTMLHASRVASQTGVPMFGINMGGLGFLTDTNQETMKRALARLFAGEHQVERRMMVEATVKPAGGGRAWTATGLNDAVIHARDRSRVVAIDIGIGRTPIGTLVADGLIVATPTGSTAYSLSAGGPIVRPTIEALVTTPISPHTLAFRPLLIGGDEVLRARVRAGHAPAAITVDGQLSRQLQTTDEVLIRRAKTHVNLLVLERGSFYGVLRAKFGWAELPRARRG
ncbi:MAG: NAD(+)/NADH kinase [Candidatus Eiseniibacteriota bacterium]